MTPYENITAVLDKIEKASKKGLNYSIDIEDINKLKEAQKQLRKLLIKHQSL